MSLVGPRPIRPRFFEELAEELPAYWQRLVVRPGPDRLRAGATRLRDLDGREARARPRVDRRPLAYGSTCARSARPAGASCGSRYTSSRESSRSRSRSTRCITSSLILPVVAKREDARRARRRAAPGAAAGSLSERFSMLRRRCRVEPRREAVDRRNSVLRRGAARPCRRSTQSSSTSSSSRASAASAARMRALRFLFLGVAASSSSPSTRITSGSDRPWTTSVASTTAEGEEDDQVAVRETARRRPSCSGIAAQRRA